MPFMNHVHRENMSHIWCMCLGNDNRLKTHMDNIPLCRVQVFNGD